jgi:exonuclease III
VIGWLKNFHDAKNKILFFQETHTTDKSEILWKNEWKDWEIHFSHGDSSSTGVATFLSKSLEYDLVDIIISPIGRYIAVIIK